MGTYIDHRVALLGAAVALVLSGCGGASNGANDNNGLCQYYNCDPDPNVCNPALCFHPDLAGSNPLDMAGQKPGDMAGQKPSDMAAPGGPMDMATTPLSGSVGPTGGSVSRLYFGFSGDARPSMCNEHTDYPTAILDSIFTRLNTAGVEFSMDLGDHMFVCQNGSQAEATAQMDLYMASAAKLKKVTFLTMGNHDCVSMTNPDYCGVNGFTTPNMVAFENALKSQQISNLPYYNFDIMTQNGLATFVVIADNAWGTPEQTWLTDTLATADAKAKYIFIFRHHPLDNTDWPAFPTISAMIMGVKHRTMTFEGHTHESRIDTYNDPTGRTAIIGNAGAPLATNFTWYGYGTVEQLQNGNLTVRTFDQSTGNQMAAYLIAPQ